VSYDVTEMRLIREDLGSRIESETVASRCGVDAADVVSAIAKLKPGKHDGYAVLHSDHLINACKDLSVYISLLFSAMLVHGCASEDMSTNTIIPIPKGRTAEISASSKYQGIALSSIFGNVFDLVFLDKFNDSLTYNSVSDEGTLPLYVLWF